MPILLLPLLAGTFAYFLITRRRSSLTIACRWRLDRRVAANHYHCLNCGAVCAPLPGQSPHRCLWAIDPALPSGEGGE